MSIPSDIYDAVRELAVAITNASEAGDCALYESLCQRLRDFYDEQASLGRWHPSLTEAVADYTDETSEAVRLYELALRQSSAYPHEPRHTKMISLAEHLIEIGRRDEAEAYLRDGRTEAVHSGDTFWIHEADRLMQGLSARHRFRVGDWVTIVKIPSNLADAANIGTARVFEQALGKAFRIEGFDRYGHIELVVTKRHTIWIEPEFVVPEKEPWKRKYQSE